MFAQRALTLTTFFLLTQNAIAQRAAMDSLYTASAVANLRQQYYTERNAESLLYIGSNYSNYKPIADEHPFFLSDDWISGDIYYNGNTYYNVPLQYDIHKQKLVTEHPASGRELELVPESISWFRLDKHRFIFLSLRETHGTISSGYYEVLVDSHVKLVASHNKAFQESTTTGKLEVRVDESTKYWIYKGGAFVPVRNKSTVLSALADKKTSLSQEIKKKGINFNRDKRSAMIQTLELYNRLPQL